MHKTEGGRYEILIKGWRGGDDRWDLPEKLAKDEETQKELFTKLAGEKMGSGIKRGRPYLWIPNHLADARNQTTPRSFLGCAANRSRADRRRLQSNPRLAGRSNRVW